MKRTAKSFILLAVFLAIVFVCMGFANAIQTDSGKVDVNFGSIDMNGKALTYKIYVPKTATADNPAPALLMLHGYQNDHETCSAYCIEMARRGVVVLALDEFGRGSSEVGMLERGRVG